VSSTLVWVWASGIMVTLDVTFLDLHTMGVGDPYAIETYWVTVRSMLRIPRPKAP